MIEEIKRSNKKQFNSNHKKGKEYESNEASDVPEYVKEFNAKKQECELLKRKNKQIFDNHEKLAAENKILQEKLIEVN